MWEPLRRAGAAARIMLIAAAARQWRVDPASCHAQNGEVIHVPTGRRAPYGVLVDIAAAFPVPTNVPLKSPNEFELIGKPVKRLDSPIKVWGEARFGIDAMVPGMLIATVAACPVPGGKLRGVDDSAAKKIAGVRQIVRLDDAVAVVADHMWAAKQGLAALDIDWDEGPNATLSTAEIVRQLDTASQQLGCRRAQGRRRRRGHRPCRDQDRGDLSDALFGARDDGADELHRPDAPGWL